MLGEKVMAEFQKDYHNMFRVNLAQLCVLATNLVAVVWLAATLSNTVENQQTQINETKTTVVSIQADQVALAKDLTAIKTTVDNQTEILKELKTYIVPPAYIPPSRSRK